MPTKPWPKAPKQKDPKPSTYRDLSVETKRIAPLGEHVYFVVWCWDMETDTKQTSILFRARRSFDTPAERLCAIDSEIVDLVADGDGLLVLENAIGREGYGVVHRLEGTFVSPKQSTALRFKDANVYAALGRGDAGELYAAGDTIQRFDGKAWKQVPVEIGWTHRISAIATNGAITVAVGKSGVVVELVKGKPKQLAAGAVTGGDLSGVHVAADGTISVAGAKGEPRQGKGGKLAKLPGFDRETDVNDCAFFQGALYWSASGKASGVHVQKGKRLASIFDDQSCFALTATDDYLFVASEAGLLRYDGKVWKQLDTKYDTAKGVWAVRPAKK